MTKRRFIFIFFSIFATIIFSKNVSMAVEKNEIKISYIIDLSESATGLESTYSYEGIDKPTIYKSNQYDILIKNGESIKIEEISNKYVTPFNTKTQYNTKDRIIIEFIGWKIEGTTQILKAGDNLSWDQMQRYATKENQVKLKTVWKVAQNYQYANFYINYKSQALDSEGNVSGQESKKFTPSLCASYVGNATKDTKYYIAGKDTDNSYDANKKIRELKGNKEDGTIYLDNIPEDDYIIAELKKYTDKLSIDGEEIKVEELNTEHYEVRWYVFKLQDNGWHIDGKLVRKEGKIIISKTFKGSKEAIEKITGYSLSQNKINSNTNFNISINGGNNTQTLNFQNYSKITNNSQGTNYEIQVKWLVDVKYGINYTIQEKEYLLSSFIVDEKYFIYDPENKQSQEEKDGNQAMIVGINNYAIDNQDGFKEENAIQINFTNVYNPIKLDSNTIIPETGGDGFRGQEAIGIFLIGTSLICFYILEKRKE